jgi:hypothetical protein
LPKNAGQWLKCRTPDGRKAYGVPSCSTPGLYYLTTQTSCTCPDALRAALGCKHQLAVRLHCERVTGLRARVPARASVAEPASTAALAAKYDEIFGRIFDD